MTDWNGVSVLLSSHYRRDVLASLVDGGPVTPTTLSDRSGEPLAHVSRALNELRGEGMVELLVDEEVRKGRIYDATEKGEEMLMKARTVKEGDADGE